MKHAVIRVFFYGVNDYLKWGGTTVQRSVPMVYVFLMYSDVHKSCGRFFIVKKGGNMLAEFKANYRGAIDSTLREGDQFAPQDEEYIVHKNGDLFTVEQQVLIAETLRDIGVDRVEVSNPLGERTRVGVEAVSKIPNMPPILAHVRARREDVIAARSLGLSGVNILCIADEERLSKMGTKGITFAQHLQELQICVGIAQEYGMETRVGVEHLFNSDLDAAMNIYMFADELGVDRVSAPDTKGGAFSWDVIRAIGYLRRHIKADIEVHFHNELGGATSNAFTAVTSGANWVDTSIMGIGERTGITSLSQFLSGLYSIDPDLTSRYNLELLTPADRMVAEMLGVDIPFNMITSGNGFKHKAGIHLDKLMKDGAEGYELFPPGVIGNERTLVIGTNVSGRTTQEDVERFYERHGRR